MKNDKWKRKMENRKIATVFQVREEVKAAIELTHLMNAKKERAKYSNFSTLSSPLPSISTPHSPLTFFSVCIGIKNKKSRRGWKWNELLVAGRASCLSADLGRGRGEWQSEGEVVGAWQRIRNIFQKLLLNDSKKKAEQQRLFYMPDISGSMYICI